jgi:hypothetical protein
MREAIRGSSEGHQRPSEGHQRVIRGHQRVYQRVIRGHQRVIRGRSSELAWELISVLLDEPRDEVAHGPSIVGDDEAVALLHGLELGMAPMLLRQLLKQLGIRRVRHEHLMNEAISMQSGRPSAGHPTRLAMST